MSTSFRPKAKILFPNSWAADSFVMKLKRFSGWEFKSSMDGKTLRVKPQEANDYILIGLKKGSSGIVAEINAEKIGDNADGFWIDIYNYARRYRS
jgi:hypothetical protein